MKRPAVLIVEDHELMAQGLRRMLEPKYRIAGIVHEGTAVPEAVATMDPDLVLLDLSLPGRSGMDVLADLTGTHPDLPVVVVTMHAERSLADMALRLGARGFVPKNARSAELIRAVAAALAGHRYLSPSIPEPRADRDPRLPAGFLGLSPRQQLILRLLGKGLSTDEIAAHLGSSHWTVHTHRKTIRRRLAFTTDWEMMRYALLVCECDRDAALGAPEGTSAL